MKVKSKWALALAPFLLTGCNDLLDSLQNPVGTSGDDVQFYVAKDRGSRTMYQDDWDATDAAGARTANAIYWGNYLDTDKKQIDEYINIYCPNNAGRGFAKYKVTPKEDEKDVAATVVNMSEVGVQWGQKGPHTFYAFYPADMADKLTQTADGKHLVRATVDYQQSPVSFKWKLNSDTETSSNTLNVISNMGTYISDNYSNGNVTDKGAAKTIYGMPDMAAAVMVARHDMAEDEFGQKVPLQFHVLADVLDITLNGPTTPNTLGGNANPEADIEGKPADFIQIQAVTLEYTDRESDTPITATAEKQAESFGVDHTHPIVGSFDLDMAQVEEDNPSANVGEMVSNVEGSPSLIMNTAMSTDGKVNYPTLFIRTFTDEGDNKNTDQNCLDHLRLRAFLIPGQVTKDDLYKLRVHIQTNCGDYYKMLETKKAETGENESGYVSSRIYPVKMGYFKARSASEFDLAHWIGQLDPNICITELSIPGAWHAAQENYQGTTTVDGTTRVWSFQEMYNAGIRAFEVHTKNGTEKKAWGDFNTAFTYNEDHTYTDDECFGPYFKSYTISNEFPDGFTANDTGSRESEGYVVNGEKYSYRRSVKFTGKMTSKKTVTEVMIPKFSLRLYRTYSNSSETGDVSLSDRLIRLASVMNTDGLIFIELGMDTEAEVKDVDYCKEIKIEYETGEQTGTFSGWQYSNNYFFDAFGGTVLNVFEPTEGWSEISRETTETHGTVTLDGPRAWAIAARSCLERLKDADNTNPDNGKKVLYAGELDANTTIADVQGQMIAKVNTNGNGNEDPTFWGDTPALFSRWVGNSASGPRTVNLKWKSPTAPFLNDVDGNLHEGLRWCYTEADNLASLIGGSNPLGVRQDAITEMNKTAFGNYNGGKHRTFYLTSLGGYINYSATADNCKAVATNLNPFVLSRLNDPSRQNVPLGLVFMNYVIPPTGEEDTYKSGELIRTIINNNKAFRLHRPDEVTAPAVEENVDSHFNNNSLSPLK